MINLNNVVLVGRLTKDIDLRKTQNNISVCQFTLAVNRPKRKDQPEEADFIQCVAWSHSADFLSSYASKGAIVSVEGEIRTRNYLNPQGEKVYITEILADKVQIISNRQENPVQEAVETAAVDSFNNGLVIEEQELPFY